MILLDFNQVIIANLMQNISFNPKEEINEDLVRHMVLSSIGSYIQKFGSKYGEMIICCDARVYWRKEIFPFYKVHRKKDRQASPYNWNKIFDFLYMIKEELKKNFPYKVLEVPGAEADDIIAVLAKESTSSVLIISSDKDFLQLQKFPNVQQYTPTFNRFISTSDPEKFMKSHIIKGDRGDGIPNFLSPGNTFASGGRQKKISAIKLEEWSGQNPADFCTTQEMQIGYGRNKLLIDLDCIPTDIKTNIKNTFENADKHRFSDFLNYLLEHKMNVLVANIDNFKVNQ